MPKKEHFSKALYTIDIGQNDIGMGLFTNKSIKQVKASVPNMITGLKTHIRVINTRGVHRSHVTVINNKQSVYLSAKFCLITDVPNCAILRFAEYILLRSQNILDPQHRTYRLPALHFNKLSCLNQTHR